MDSFHLSGDTVRFSVQENELSSLITHSKSAIKSTIRLHFQLKDRTFRFRWTVQDLEDLGLVKFTLVGNVIKHSLARSQGCLFELQISISSLFLW